MYSFSYWNQSVVPCPVLTVASWPAYRFHKRNPSLQGGLTLLPGAQWGQCGFTRLPGGHSEVSRLPWVRPGVSPLAGWALCEPQEKSGGARSGSPLASFPVAGAFLFGGASVSFSVQFYEEVFLVAQSIKNPPAVKEMRVWSLGQEDPLEKEMATHSSILAWRIPWREEPGHSVWGHKSSTQL